MAITEKVTTDYARCHALARAHYENFPIAVRCFPRTIQDAIVAIYAFARHADDIADEGKRSAIERQTQLNDFSEKIKKIARQETIDEPYFLALSDAVHRHNLDTQLLLDLLVAFTFDTTLTSLPDEATLIWYCQHSANPVGRLLLQLFGVTAQEALHASDALCTSLQCINFLQDWYEDLTQRERLYLPLSTVKAAGLSLEALRTLQTPDKITRLLKASLAQAEHNLQTGRRLLSFLSWRPRIYIFLVIWGARGIITALKGRKQPHLRPTLSIWRLFCAIPLLLQNAK